MDEAKVEMREDEFDGRPELLRKRATAEFTSLVWKGFWLIVVAVILALLAIDAFQGIKSRQELLDCTQPSGKCFQEGQARTGEAVNSIVTRGQQDELVTRRTMIFAIICSNSLGANTVRELDNCIEDLLDKEPLQEER